MNGCFIWDAPDSLLADVVLRPPLPRLTPESRESPPPGPAHRVSRGHNSETIETAPTSTKHDITASQTLPIYIHPFYNLQMTAWIQCCFVSVCVPLTRKNIFDLFFEFDRLL